jgi:type I site-specific restriction endonuclease
MLMGVTELSGLNEARTRKELIDPALKKADWDVTLRMG